MKSLNAFGLMGIFLAIFWVFGLMLALDRTRADETMILPSLKVASNYEIEGVVLKREGKVPEEFHFTRSGDEWTLKQGGQPIKIESFRIRDLVRQVREARRDTETSLPNDPAAYGLQPPKATLTLIGKPRKKIEDMKFDAPEDAADSAAKEREWKLSIGNESNDKTVVYVSTPDRPNRVFAVPKASIAALFFKNANDLRSKRPFEFSEPTVQAISLKEGSAEFEAKKTRGSVWQILKPNLGYADYEGSQTPKEFPPKDAPPSLKAPEEGLKALLTAIAALRVDSEDDFVAPASDTLQRNDLVAGKEKLRIQVFAGDERKPKEETLLVGRLEGDFYYARLATDEGTFKLPRKLLEPIFDALKSPEKLRSRDLSPVPLKDADAVTLSIGKDEARFAQSGKAWFVALPGAAGQKQANNRSVDSLLDALQGRRDVLAFKDVPAADASKVDAELGFDAPQAAIAVYLDSIESGKDAKFDDPKLKKDAKAAVSWQFGKTENDQVWVKRTMADGPAARFSIKKTVLEKFVPREGLLGYAEPLLPKSNPADVVSIDIDRGGKSILLEKKNKGWIIKDATGETPADAQKVQDLVAGYSALQVRRWVKTLDAKDDLEALGLKSPPLALTFTVQNNQPKAERIAEAIGKLGGLFNGLGLIAFSAAWNDLQSGTEKVVLKFGKESTEKDDGGNVFVQHSKSDRLGLVPSVVMTVLRDTDFRDKSTILQPQVTLAVMAVVAPAGQPLAGWIDASPLITGQLGRGEASQVKQLRVTVRTAVEVRTFDFVRKDKNWVDQSGLKEFQVDDEHVNIVAKLIAGLEVNRVVMLAGGPKADQKLTSKDATVIIDALMTDGKDVHMAIGAGYEGLGHFTQISTWPGAVFLIGPDRVQPLLNGAVFFAKARVAAN